MKTCFNTITAGLDRPLEDIIAACGTVGFDGMELDLRAIDESAERGITLNDISGMLADGALAPVSVMALDLAPFAADEVARDRFRRGAEVASQLGAEMLLTFCGAEQPENMTRQEAIEVLGERAASYGAIAGNVKVALEPIGRKDLMGGPQSALEVAKLSGMANVGIMMDTFHYYLSEIPDSEILAIPSEKLLIFHVNDSEDRPISDLRDSHRLHLGEGILPLDHDLELIKTIGFDGYASVEIFREEYWAQPVTKVVSDAKTSMDRWLNGKNS